LIIALSPKIQDNNATFGKIFLKSKNYLKFEIHINNLKEERNLEAVPVHPVPSIESVYGFYSQFRV
jgi:hypothetical protein